MPGGESVSLWREATANSRHCGCVCLCGSTAMNWHLVQGELLDSLCERQDRLLCLGCQDEDDGWSDILVLRCAMIELCVVVCFFFLLLCCPVVDECHTTSNAWVKALLFPTFLVPSGVNGMQWGFPLKKGPRPNFSVLNKQQISIFIGKREKGKKRRFFLSVRIKTAQLS